MKVEVEDGTTVAARGEMPGMGAYAFQGHRRNLIGLCETAEGPRRPVRG